MRPPGRLPGKASNMPEFDRSVGNSAYRVARRIGNPRLLPFTRCASSNPFHSRHVVVCRNDVGRGTRFQKFQRLSAGLSLGDAMAKVQQHVGRAHAHQNVVSTSNPRKRLASAAGPGRPWCPRAAHGHSLAGRTAVLIAAFIGVISRDKAANAGRGIRARHCSDPSGVRIGDDSG